MTTKFFSLTVTIILALTVLLAGESFAQSSPWQFRLRGIVVIPDESATITAINGDVAVATAYVPEFDITYFINRNFALELILATTKHKAVAIGTDLGDVDLGSVRLLPPILTLQYHLAPGGQIRPYVGVGVNLTLFYDSKAPGTTVTAISYDHAIGFALQAGADIPMQGNWFLNVDLKKVFLSTDVSINGGAITADVKLDPWIAGVGFGYRF